MSKNIKIVGLGGSLEKSSASLAALKISLESAAQAGAETEIFDLSETRLPLYEDLKPTPEAAVRLAEAVFSAQGMIWCSPLYHGTVSGVFKNALDWLELLSKREPAYLTDRAIGLICTAGGAQGLQAINTMEFAVRALRGWTVPFTVPIARAWNIFDREGRVSDAKVQEQLTILGREVVQAARKLSA